MTGRASPASGCCCSVMPLDVGEEPALVVALEVEGALGTRLPRLAWAGHEETGGEGKQKAWDLGFARHDSF
jgi:hypothetical protein